MKGRGAHISRRKSFDSSAGGSDSRVLFPNTRGSTTWMYASFGCLDANDETKYENVGLGSSMRISASYRNISTEFRFESNIVGHTVESTPRTHPNRGL